MTATEEPSMTPQADPKLRVLLTAYGSTLDEPKVPGFAALRLRRAGLYKFLRLPTLRLGLTYLLAHHMTRTSNRLRSRYQALAASRPSSEQLEENIKRLDFFQASLPRAPFKSLFVIWFGVAALIAVPLAKLLFQETGADGAISAVVGAAMETDISKLVGELFSKDGLTAMAILSVTLYCLAILPLSAYRWQRILFTRHPEHVDRTERIYLEDFARPSGGIYQLQEDVFGSIGARPVNEIPWELCGRVGALFAALPLWLWLEKPTGDVELLGPVNLHGVLGVLLVAVVGAGALLIIQDWRKRNGEQPRVPVQRSARATATPRHTERVSLPQIASLWVRAAAFSIDAFIIVVIAAFIGGYGSDVITEVDSGLLVFLALPVAAAFFSAVTMRRRGEHRGQTLGKQAAGIRLVTADGEDIGLARVFVREGLFKWGIVVGIGSVYTLFAPLMATIVWAVLNKSNRAPHDLLAGTVVVYAKERAPAQAMVARSASA